MSEKRLQLYGSLKATFLHIDNHEKAYLADFGLSIPRFYILLHISHKPGINYIDLSDLLLCTKSNTTRLIQGMVKEGMINREVDPDDGRSFKLYLTEKGNDLLNQVYPGFVKQVNQLMSRFTDEEASRFLEVSQHIESNLSPDSSLNLSDSQILSWHNGQNWEKDE